MPRKNKLRSSWLSLALAPVCRSQDAPDSWAPAARLPLCSSRVCRLVVADPDRRLASEGLLPSAGSRSLCRVWTFLARVWLSHSGRFVLRFFRACRLPSSAPLRSYHPSIITHATHIYTVQATWPCESDAAASRTPSSAASSALCPATIPTSYETRAPTCRAPPADYPSTVALEPATFFSNDVAHYRFSQPWQGLAWLQPKEELACSADLLPWRPLFNF